MCDLSKGLDAYILNEKWCVCISLHPVSVNAKCAVAYLDTNNMYSVATSEFSSQKCLYISQSHGSLGTKAEANPYFHQGRTIYHALTNDLPVPRDGGVFIVITRSPYGNKAECKECSWLFHAGRLHTIEAYIYHRDM